MSAKRLAFNNSCPEFVPSSLILCRQQTLFVVQPGKMAGAQTYSADLGLTMLHPAVHCLGRRSTSQASPHDEATLYIRGFMSSVGRPDEQALWRRNHDQVVQSHGRGGEAFDYCWQHNRSAGLPDLMPGSMARCIMTIGYIPLPLFTSAVMTSRLIHALRGQRRLPVYRPSRPALALAVDVVSNGGRMYTQWTRATNNARAEDEVQRLQSAVLALRSRYTRVHIVAYSLGCRLALHACPLVPSESRPDEVHLVAAAVRASEAKPLLAGLSQGSTHVYFSRDDHVLRLLYGLAEGSPALGYEGLPPSRQENHEFGHGHGHLDCGPVVQHDTSPLFEGKVSRSNLLAVHLMYSTLWADVAYGGAPQLEDESN